jgi:hypothetical protein
MSTTLDTHADVFREVMRRDAIHRELRSTFDQHINDLLIAPDDAYQLGWVRGFTAGLALGDDVATSDELAREQENAENAAPWERKHGEAEFAFGWLAGFAEATADRPDAQTCVVGDCQRRILTDIDDAYGECRCTDEYGCRWHDDVCRCSATNVGGLGRTPCACLDES